MRRAIVLSVALAVALSACKKKAEISAPPKGGRGGMRGNAMFPVDTIVVESRKADYEVKAPGTLAAFERVQVTARVAGVVDRVAFKEGQDVKKGDVLVVIDAERYQLAVNSANAAVEKAKAAQSDAEAMVARREGASEAHPGLITGEELGTLQTKVLTAKADVAVARESLRSAQVNLRDASVRAPMAGVIQTRTVETGQYVNPGYVMATLLRTDPMLLKFEVLPEDAPRIKPGMKLTFTLRESQRTYDAEITLVSASADETTHMVGITAQVENQEHKFWLRPGAFADVDLHVGAQREAVIVPRLAIRPTERGFVAYVIQNGVAHEHTVTLGMTTSEGWVEVRQGLEAGSHLVVRGMEPLAEGSRVKETQITPDQLSAAAVAASAGAAGPIPPTPPGSAVAPPPPAASSAGRRRSKP